jgi:hypothetical protein
VICGPAPAAAFGLPRLIWETGVCGRVEE